MRLGKWIRIFNQIVPIPANFSSSFGLVNGSMLHFAMVKPPVPITSPSGAATPNIAESNKNIKPYVEIIISTIPRDMWGTVCSLSVRMKDQPGALAIATKFLRDNKISIILSEAAGTFGGRAHWDCVCDLTHCEFFTKAKIKPDDDYLKKREKMKGVVDRLSIEFKKWVKKTKSYKEYFTEGEDQHILFNLLTGLNYANQGCFKTEDSSEKDNQYNGKMPFVDGGIELPEDLLKRIEDKIGLDNWNNILPSHALITCNTEQRYMRLYFIPHVGEFVSAEIGFEIENVASDGIGLYHQILSAMPENLNLLHITLHRIHEIVNDQQDDEKENAKSHEIGKIRLVGHWKVDEFCGDDIRNKISELKNPERRRLALKNAIEVKKYVDVDDKPLGEQLFGENEQYKKVAWLENLHVPKANDPAVYISHPMEEDAKEFVQILKRKLSEAGFLPITGSGVGGFADIGARRVSTGIEASAFSPINSCFAFILLCKKDGKYVSKKDAHFISPWLIAEEAYAFSRAVFFMARLAEKGMELPKYKSDILTFEFEVDDDNQDEFSGNAAENLNIKRAKNNSLTGTANFEKQVRKLIKALKNTKQHKDYEDAVRGIRRSMYEGY